MDSCGGGRPQEPESRSDGPTDSHRTTVVEDSTLRAITSSDIPQFDGRLVRDNR